MPILKSAKYLTLTLALLPCVGFAENVFEIGGDVYVSESDASLSANSDRDAFLAGFSVHLAGNVTNDAHLAGFTINMNGNVNEDLYAAGSTINIRGSVGSDASIAGFTVRLEEGASIAGNARIAAATVVSEAPVEGSLVASGGTITINNTISGDVRLNANDISFGENAKINGSLQYSTPEKMDIPASVIDPARVEHVPYSANRRFGDVRDSLDDTVKGFWPSFFSAAMGAVITLIFLTLIAALLLAMAPVAVERLRERATGHTWRALFFGFLGLSTLIGMIVVSLLTIVGIPLILIVLLAIVVIWTLGYLLGVYTIFVKIYTTYRGPVETTGTKVLVVAIGLVVVAMLNYIPIVGWLINLSIVLFGVGLFTMASMQKLLKETRAPGLNVENFGD